MTEYLLSQQGSPDLERSRLRLLQEFHDPLTICQPDAIGNAEWLDPSSVACRIPGCHARG